MDASMEEPVAPSLCENCLVEPWSQSRIRRIVEATEFYDFSYFVSSQKLRRGAYVSCWWCCILLNRILKSSGARELQEDDWTVWVSHHQPQQRVEPREIDRVEVYIGRYSVSGSFNIEWLKRIRLGVYRKDRKYNH
jgi:hypothetical protein